MARSVMHRHTATMLLPSPPRCLCQQVGHWLGGGWRRCSQRDGAVGLIRHTQGALYSRRGARAACSPARWPGTAPRRRRRRRGAPAPAATTARRGAPPAPAAGLTPATPHHAPHTPLNGTPILNHRKADQGQGPQCWAPVLPRKRTAPAHLCSVRSLEEGVLCPERLGHAHAQRAHGGGVARAEVPVHRRRQGAQLLCNTHERHEQRGSAAGDGVTTPPAGTETNRRLLSMLWESTTAPWRTHRHTQRSPRCCVASKCVLGPPRCPPQAWAHTRLRARTHRSGSPQTLRAAARGRWRRGRGWRQRRRRPTMTPSWPGGARRRRPAAASRPCERRWRCRRARRPGRAASDERQSSAVEQRCWPPPQAAAVAHDATLGCHNPWQVVRSQGAKRFQATPVAAPRLGSLRAAPGLVQVDDGAGAGPAHGLLEEQPRQHLARHVEVLVVAAQVVVQGRLGRRLRVQHMRIPVCALRFYAMSQGQRKSYSPRLALQRTAPRLLPRTAGLWRDAPGASQ